MNRLLLLGWIVVVLSSCGEAESTSPPPATSSEPATAAGSEPSGAPHPLPAEIVADVVLPGTPPDRHMSVRVSLGALPWTIVGCITPGAAPCEETMRVELDEPARTALVQAIEDIRAIPRCEPDGIFPDDRPFELTLTGFPSPYRAALPGDPSLMATRNEGPCRASARLAWLLVQWFSPGTAAPAGPPLPPAVES
jgi:hypothetical protein